MKNHKKKLKESNSNREREDEYPSATSLTCQKSTFAYQVNEQTAMLERQ